MNSKSADKMMKWSITLFLMFISLTIFSQKRISFDFHGTVPLDPHVRMGILPNGLTYYIRENFQPENKIEMQLVVKAGAVHEDSDQLEYAHLTEHMAFEGTRHFPGDSMLNYTALHGMRLGNEFTAGTATTDTHYDLTIPADNPELFQNSLQILRDWAQDFTLNPERVYAQRGAILGEMRGGAMGIYTEMTAKMRQKVLNNDRYTYEYHKAREENIRHGKYEPLVRFYKEWYRPDLQAVIIVGAINAERTEERIKILFGDLRPPRRPRKVENFAARLAGHITEKNQSIILTHPGKSGTELYLYLKKKGGFDLPTHQDYKESIIEDLFNNLVTKRNYTLSHRYNLPFKSVYTSFKRDFFFPLTQIDGVTVEIKLDHAESIQVAFKDVMTVLEGVKRYGFTEEELRNAKKKFENDFKTLNRSRSIDMLRKFRAHFVHGNAAPSPEYKEEMTLSLVKEIGLDEINAFAQKWINFDKNCDVVILAPEKDKPNLPDKSTIEQWLKHIKKAKLPAYQENKEISSLMADIQLPLSVDEVSYHVKTNTKLGVTELHLSNGVKVIMYTPPGKFSTAKQSSEIELLGYSNGGSSSYQGMDRVTAENASAIVFNSGVDQFDKFQLDVYLRARKVSANPYIADAYEQVQGSGPVEEIETVLQMIYLYFTTPRKDEVAFKDWKTTKTEEIKNEKTNSRGIFSKLIDSLTISKQTLSLEELKQINLDNAYRIYKERFSNAADFTFFVTGAFNKPGVKQLILKYLGNLPVGGKKEERVEPSYVLTSKIDKTIYTNTPEGKSDVRLYFPGMAPYQYDTKNNLMLQVLGEALRHKIMDRLRTKEGGAYSPGANMINTRLSKKEGTYRFSVYFNCEPDNTENMIRYALEEFRKLKDEGLSQELFDKSVARIQNVTEAYVQKGISARYGLKDYYLHRENLHDFFNQPKVLDSISLEDINKAARQYLTEELFQRFVMLNKKYKPQ